ncbi:MAG: PASTA domain-containing protein [Acidobacteria bacterium]|nr:PASTA domain-containing protein [Acidobacteriota bacterium]
MPLSARVLTAGKVLLLFVALVATYLLFAAASMRVALRAREVQVPNLANRTAADANAIAAPLGLTLKVDETRRPDPKIAAGRVLAQEPSAGSVARRQRVVKLWLSAGPRTSSVPKLVGETERAAQLRLAQDGFTLASIAEIRSQDAPDVVVAQNPPPKSGGEQVALLVNRGDRGESYVMPDLIGLVGERTADALRAHGFRVAVVGSVPYPGVAGGIVVRQNPQAGFQIGPGEPVSLEVSR